MRIFKGLKSKVFIGDKIADEFIQKWIDANPEAELVEIIGIGGSQWSSPKLVVLYTLPDAGRIPYR